MSDDLIKRSDVYKAVDDWLAGRVPNLNIKDIPSADEPTTQMKTQNSNLTFEKDECAKEYEELGLKELKELIEADRKTEPSNSEKLNNCEEPQYEMGMGTLKCDNCSEYGSFKCTKCDGEMYFKRLEPKDEPQTCDTCKHNGEKHAYDYACDKCTDMDKFQHEDELQTQLTAKCLNCNNSKVCKEKQWDGC